MLGDFEKELTAEKSLKSKQVPYYIRWVRATGSGLKD